MRSSRRTSTRRLRPNYGGSKVKSAAYKDTAHPMNIFYLKGYEAAKSAYYDKNARTLAQAKASVPAAWWKSTSEAGKAFQEGFKLAWSAAAHYIKMDEAGDDGATLRWNRGAKRAPTKVVTYWKTSDGYACRPSTTGVVRFDTLKALKHYMAIYFGDKYITTFKAGAQSEARVSANPRRNGRR